LTVQKYGAKTSIWADFSANTPEYIQKLRILGYVDIDTVMPDPDPASPVSLKMGDFTSPTLRVQK
jgi:hypothetical protein